MPLRSQIDLRQFHRFARWMVIAEPDLATRRIPLRLVGSGFHDLVGRDLTGTDYLDLSDPDIRSTAFDGMMSLINHPVALWQQTPIQLPSGKLTTFEYTIFPMLHEKENRHQLLVLVSHQLSDGPALGGVPTPLRSSDWVFLDLGKGFPKIETTAAA
jgi:hypothetical protein